MQMSIDPGAITLDELEHLADIMPDVGDALMGGQLKVTPRVMKGFAYVLMRRENPDVTLEDAGKLTLGSFVVDDPKDSNGHGD